MFACNSFFFFLLVDFVGDFVHFRFDGVFESFHETGVVGAMRFPKLVSYRV